eukprot:3936020-Rhodomonas_salina.2
MEGFTKAHPGEYMAELPPGVKITELEDNWDEATFRETKSVLNIKHFPRSSSEEEQPGMFRPIFATIMWMAALTRLSAASCFKVGCFIAACLATPAAFRAFYLLLYMLLAFTCATGQSMLLWALTVVTAGDLKAKLPNFR